MVKAALLGVAALALGPYAAVAQICMPGGPCISVPKPTGSAGGGGGSSGSRRTSQSSRSSPADKKAYKLNDEGLAAYKKKDWATAAADFTKALKLNPRDDVIRANLAHTQLYQARAALAAGDVAAERNYYRQALANDPASDPDHSTILAEAGGMIDAANTEANNEKQRVIQDAAAAAGMKDSLSRMASSPPSDHGGTASSGLTFTDSVLDGPSDQKVARGALDSKVAKPNAIPAAAAAPVAVQRSIDQLSSMANSGAAANAKGIAGETAKTNSNCGADTAACAKFVPVSMPNDGPPSVAKLLEHIPGPARKDRLIQKSMAYYQHLEGLKNDTQARLAAIQRKIDGGAGDATVLNAEKSTLNNDVKRYEAYQLNTQGEIKAQLLKIHMDWDESPAPATGAAVKK